MHNCAAVMHPNQLEWLIRSVTVTMTSNYRNICPSSWQLMQSWAFDRRTRKTAAPMCDFCLQEQAEEGLGQEGGRCEGKDGAEDDGRSFTTLRPEGVCQKKHQRRGDLARAAAGAACGGSGASCWRLIVAPHASLDAGSDGFH